MKKKAIFLSLLVSFVLSVNVLAQEFYYFDTNEVFPWGWQMRKTTYEDGSVNWAVSFALRSSSSDITWNDIEEVKIFKKIDDSFSEVSFSIGDKHDDYINVIGANFDPQASWLRTTCPVTDDPFSCFFPVHETWFGMSGLEPQLNETYVLQIKLKGNYYIFESLPWKMPMTMNLKPVPYEIAQKIITGNGKVVQTGNKVPAISIKEMNDGSLVVQYIVPFIEETPPPYVWVYDDQMNLADNAWQGTHIRVGIRLTLDASDPNNPMYLVWPNIPSNVGTVVFPKELVNIIKTNEQFTGTFYFGIQHRDRLNIARWSTNIIPYVLLKPEPISD